MSLLTRSLSVNFGSSLNNFTVTKFKRNNNPVSLHSHEVPHLDVADPGLGPAAHLSLHDPHYPQLVGQPGPQHRVERRDVPQLLELETAAWRLPGGGSFPLLGTRANCINTNIWVLIIKDFDRPAKSTSRPKPTLSIFLCLR